MASLQQSLAKADRPIRLRVNRSFFAETGESFLAFEVLNDSQAFLFSS